MRPSPFTYLTSTFILVCLLLISCKNTPVSWPDLITLDQLTIEIERVTYERDHNTQKTLLREATILIDRIAVTIPKNAHQPELVVSLLSDLISLRHSMNFIESLDQSQLETLSYSIHPIVEELMTTAGVPHVHADNSQN